MTMEVTRTMEDTHTVDRNSDPAIDDLLKMSTQLWVQLLDYEKSMEQILKLDLWLKQHQARPILLTVPKHNFRFSVGEGVKNMYDKYRLLQWTLAKDTAHRIETHSRQHRGVNMHVNLSAVQAQSPVALQVDWPSQFWLLVDKEGSRSS